MKKSIGILEILGLIFVVLKLVGVVDWSWPFVVLPFIISVTINLASFLIACFLLYKVEGKNFWRYLKI